MLHSINSPHFSFPHYKYDDQEGIVLTYHFKKRNEIVIEKLKWLTMNNGTTSYKRVTLFEKGNPHYFSEAQILKMIKTDVNPAEVEKESIVIDKDGKKLFQGSDKEAKKVVKEIEKEEQLPIEPELSEDEQFQKQMEKVIQAFQERGGKSIRRDVFVQKFGSEFTDKCLEEMVLVVAKSDGKTFYSLPSY